MAKKSKLPVATSKAAIDIEVSLAQKIANAVKAKYSKAHVGLATLDTKSRSQVTKVISIKISAINHHLFGELGGIPCGRIGEVYSDEGNGKTSFALEVIAAAQRAGGTGILAETETALDKKRAVALDVDLKNLVLLESETTEDLLEELEEAVKQIDPNGPPVAVVWDSLAATPTRKEKLEGITEKKAAMAERGRVMARAMRTLTMLVAQYNFALIIVNQTRTKLGISFGDPTTTPSSGVLKFHCSWRIHIRGGKEVKAGDIVTGKQVIFWTKKNKLAPEHRKVVTQIMYDERGWNEPWTLLNFAKDMGVIAADRKVSKAALEEARVGLGWPKSNVELDVPDVEEKVVKPKKNKKKIVVDDDGELVDAEPDLDEEETTDDDWES